jgi:hypothetical protein
MACVQGIEEGGSWGGTKIDLGHKDILCSSALFLLFVPRDKHLLSLSKKSSIKIPIATKRTPRTSDVGSLADVCYPRLSLKGRPF